jgi:threonine aldolase
VGPIDLRPIDLRSDTVTLPSPEMRAAMAAAELGDDVYGEDPSVNLLEDRAAARSGKEAGLFVPSGTMGNLLAVMAHTRPGDEIICGQRTHTYVAKAAGAARIAGVSVWPIPHERGRLDGQDIASAIHPPDDSHYPRSALLIVEQPHAGWVMPLEDLRTATGIAREHGLAVHMDGARIFNAAVALDMPVAEIAQHADTVMFCISKGLAAPVGSLIVGPVALIGQARPLRKVLGGGMRQAGVLAAAGLFALDRMVDRLAADHANAAGLADGLRELGWRVDRDVVQTNIFFVEPPVGVDATHLVETLAGMQVQVTSPYAGAMRLVTHYGIEANDIARVIEAFHRATRVLR